MAILRINNFSGAITTISSKSGIENSARFIKAANPFQDPNYLTLAKKTTKISSTTVTGLPHFFEDFSPWSTNRCAYD